MTVVAAQSASPVGVERTPWGPPGRLFFLATGLVVLVVADAVSRDSFTMSLLGLAGWALVALVWLVRFLRAAWRDRLRMSRTHWVRWLAVPLALALAFALTTTDGPTNVRFSLSRDAMDQAAAEVMAGGSTDRGWIGLYPVVGVQRISNGMRFLIADGGFIDRIGFAYSTYGEPQGPEGDADTYTPLGGGWWLWVEHFD